MTLASSTRLGRYEIRLKIGEGGMGEMSLGGLLPGPLSLLLSNVAGAYYLARRYDEAVRQCVYGQTCG